MYIANKTSTQFSSNALHRLASVAIATVCLMFAQVSWSTELLANPGFELGPYSVSQCAGNVPVVSGTVGSWWNDNSCWDTRPRSVTYAVDTVTKHSGLQSQSIALAGTPGVAQFYTRINLTAGQLYTTSIWLMADRPLEVQLQTRGEGPPYLNYGVQVAQVTTTWKKFTFTALAPNTSQGTLPGLLLVLLQTPGKIWMDDASVTSVADQVGDPLPNTVVPKQYFGMHVHRDPNWPAIGNVYGSERLWDAEGVQWIDIFKADPSTGAQPNWTAFDLRVNRVVAHGAEPVMVLGGNIPTWASVDPTGAAGCNFYALGSSAPPVSRAVWQSWVKAVATHAKGRIHYWEIWNEPYQCPLLDNNMPLLVQLAADASAILKAVDPANVVLSPSFGAWDNARLDRYLNAGGAAYTNILSLHAYDTFIGNLLDGTVAIQSRNGDLASAEDMFITHRLVANTRLVLARHGLKGIPIWNTEGGYLFSQTASGAPNDAAGAPFLVRNYLVEWAAGFDRNFYYSWDQRGLAVTPGRETVEGSNIYLPSAAGVAYQQVAAWLTGATMSSRNIDPTTGTWQISLQRGTATSIVVWNPARSVSFTVPVGMNQSADIAGNTASVLGTITVGPSPVLLTSHP